ncbi:MAG: tRNA 2-thiouridine(34) synthase MnmA [Firmicutes bacterium]|nr:tRNA 2-thiouridine(34) synthase MnmA [Bacillota bacterium]
MSNVAIGMSGGVDSSVAAALLVQQGHNVIGVTMKLHNAQLPDNDCCNSRQAADALQVAKKIGIPHHVVDFTDEFHRYVVDYFINEYKRGKTPNPCAVCNRLIKFDALFEKAKTLGADYIATGHYAKIVRQGGRFCLQRAADEKKDQTYFLYSLSQLQLSKSIMPLGQITKNQTREIANNLGLATAKSKESQEICFIPDNDYAAFIERKAGISPHGDFIYNGEIVGKHRGVIHYTVGQRKGLGLALGEPVYVTKIDPKANKIHLGTEKERYGTELFASSLNFMPFEELEKEIKCTAKIRYNAKDSACTVRPVENGVHVIFEQPQKAITPGQSIVFYHNDIVLGGGRIDA